MRDVVVVDPREGGKIVSPGGTYGSRGHVAIFTLTAARHMPHPHARESFPVACRRHVSNVQRIVARQVASYEVCHAFT